MEKDVAQVAERFLDAVQSAIDTLSRAPEIGAPKLFKNSPLAGLRSWPVPGYSSIRIYYIHAANEPRIIRILHGKRDISSLLEEEPDSQE